MFGIQFVSNGVAKYITSKNSWYLDEDITKVFQFRTEQTATRVLKRLRLDGHETGGLFSIIKIKFVPDFEIQVPHPKPKIGFVITRLQNGVKKHYLGAARPVKTLGDYLVVDGWGAVQRTTTFKTEALAWHKVTEMEAYCNDRITHYTTQVAKASSYGYTKRQAESNLESFTKKLAMLKGCSVELI